MRCASNAVRGGVPRPGAGVDCPGGWTAKHYETVLPAAQVKFFERVKLERAIKKLERALADAAGGGAAAAPAAAPAAAKKAKKGAAAAAGAGAGGGGSEDGEEDGEEEEVNDDAEAAQAAADVAADPVAAAARLAGLKEDLIYVLNFPKVSSIGSTSQGPCYRARTGLVGSGYGCGVRDCPDPTHASPQYPAMLVSLQMLFSFRLHPPRRSPLAAMHAG